MSSNFKELVKSTSKLGVARIVEFIVGLVKIKLCAIILGTTGMGVFNQLSFLSNKMSTFTLLSTGEAFVKQLAENAHSDNAKQLVLSALKSYITLIFIFMLSSSVVLFLLSEKITLYVFGDIQYFQVFLVALVSLPLLVVNSIPYSLMRAFKDINAIAKARIIIVLINLFHALPLIYFFALKGAVISVFLSHLVGMIVNVFFAKKLYFRKFDISILNIGKAELVPKFVKELITFSGFGISIGLYVIASEFICRSIVISHLGIDAIGLYGPIIMWSTLFTSFLVPALTTYLFSSLCQSKTNLEISGLLNDGLRLATFGLLPLLFLAIPYRELIISIFYTVEFIAVEKYLPFHFIGVIFQVWFSVLSSSMTSTGRIRQHGFFRFFYLSLDIAVTYYCVLQWGLYGWMLKHIVSPIIFYFIYLAYCNKNMRLKLSRDNILVMFYLISGSIFMILIDKIFDDGYFHNYLIGPFLLAFSYILLTSFEKQIVTSKFNAFLKRKGLKTR